MMELAKINLSLLAKNLSRPFMMQQIALLDYFALYVYLARGIISTHQHRLYDELFYVINGTLKLESENKTISLHTGEIAVIPRGVTHTSGSFIDTTVLFGQTQADSERKNGHSGAKSGYPNIVGINPRDLAGGLTPAFFSVSLLQVDEMVLRAAWCQGEVKWHRHTNHDEMLLVQEGQLEVVVEHDKLTLQDNEMVVIPRRQVHQLRTIRQTLLLSLIHVDVSPSEQMGYAG